MDDKFIGFLLLMIIATLFFRYNFDNGPIKSKHDSTENAAHVSEQETSKVENIVKIDTYDDIFNNLNDYKNSDENHGRVCNDDEDCEIIKNQYITVSFSKQNGRIQSVKLTEYKDYNNEYVELIDNTFIDNIHIVFQNNAIYDTYKSTNVVVEKQGDRKIIVTYIYEDEDDNRLLVTNTFELSSMLKHRYELKRDITIEGCVERIKNIELQIYDNIRRQENNAEDCSKKVVIKYLDKNSKIVDCYVKNKYTSCPDTVQWLNIMQKFFSVGLSHSSVNGEFKNVKVKLIPYEGAEKQKYLHTAKVILEPFNKVKEELESNLNYYFGPNIKHYMSFFSYNFDKNLYFGVPVIRLLNEYVVDKIVKVCHELFRMHSVVILLLLLILFFILYLPLFARSLKIKKKIELLGATIQHINAENSKNIGLRDLKMQTLYRKAKINSKSTLFIVFLQAIFFTAMLSFIPQEISFRNEQFLWCKDLSNYDSILDFSFHIPIYGNHVGLFSLLSLFLVFIISFIKSLLAKSDDKKKENNGFVKNLISVFIILCFNNTCAALQLFYYGFMHIMSIFECFIDNIMCDPIAIENELRKDVDNFRKNNYT